MGLMWCTNPWTWQSLISLYDILPRSFQALRRARSSTVILLTVNPRRRGMEMPCSPCRLSCSLGIFLATSAIIWIRDPRNQQLAVILNCFSYWTELAMNRGRSTVHHAWTRCIHEHFGSTGTCFLWPISLDSRYDSDKPDSIWSLYRHSLVILYILSYDSGMVQSYLNSSSQWPRSGLTSLRSGS